MKIMGNCLKNTLKGSVNNDNLPVFGFQKVAFTAEQNYGYEIYVTGFTDAKIKAAIIKDGVFSYQGSEYSDIDVQGWNVTVTPEAGKVCYFNVDITKSTYLTGSFILNQGAWSETVQGIELLLGNYDNCGSTDGITKRYKNLKVLIAKNTKITGNITDFIGCDDLIWLNFANTYVEGSLDALLSGILTNKPDRTGTLKIYGNNVITYKSNGDGTGDDVIIPNFATKTITFDGQGGYSIA